jgi:hypothetical protein
MELTYDEIDQHLCKIFAGEDYVYIDGLFFKFRFPDSKIRHMSNLIYANMYREAVENGIMPRQELEKLLNSKKFLSSEETSRLKKLESQLEAQEVLLSKTFKVKARQENIKNTIQRLRREVASLKVKVNSKFMMSAEVKAEEEKNFFICARCTYDENNNLYWENYTRATKEKDFGLKDKIFYQFINFYNGLSTGIVREIARSSAWRVRYVHSIKTSESLFGIPTSEYTTDQINLVYWSNYYQSIYEMMPEDRPSDLVIDDDESLDAYMKSFYEERNRDAAARKSKSKRRGKLSAFDAEEVIVTRSHELYQEIEYNIPKEAQKIKDRIDLRKRTRRGKD